MKINQVGRWAPPCCDERVDSCSGEKCDTEVESIGKTNHAFLPIVIIYILSVWIVLLF